MATNSNSSAEDQAASLARIAQQFDGVVLNKAETLTLAATNLWRKTSDGNTLAVRDLEQSLAEIASLQEALANYRLGLLATVGQSKSPIDTSNRVTFTLHTIEGETLQVETDEETIYLRRLFVNGETARIGTLGKSYSVQLETPSKTYTIRGREFAVLYGFPLTRFADPAHADSVGLQLAVLAEVKLIINHYEEA